MSNLPNDLTTYLNTILDVKQQIDGVLSYETGDSTPFAQYPTYIASAIQGGGGSGSSVDPYYGSGLDIGGAISDDTFPVNSDLVFSEIWSYFTVNKTPNDAIESVEWKQPWSVDGNEYTIKYVVETSHDLAGNDTGAIENYADDIAQSLEDYPDLYEHISPVLTEATMTKSSDPRTDGYDYLIEGNLYGWNLRDNCEPVETITENGFFTNSDAAGYDIQGGGGSSKGDPIDMFVSIRPGYSGLSNYPYFYDQWIDTGNSDNSVDGSVTVHTLISDGFPSWGIDTNDFVSSIKKFEVYDWNSGNPAALYDLTCTTMVQEYSSDTDCWCLVEGTLQNATNVCFKSDNGSWDDMSSQWSMDNNWTLMECMPVVDTGGYVLYEGTYISLPAGEVCMYLHYQASDGDACNVYIRVYDETNQMWTDKWKAIEYTNQTFVNPSANE